MDILSQGSFQWVWWKDMEMWDMDSSDTAII